MFRWQDRDGTVHYSDQPPPPEAKKVQEKRLRTASVIETSDPSYSQRKAMQDFPVTLYTAPECDTECKMGREYLGRRGIPFAEVALETDEQYAAYKQLFGSGDIQVPAMTVGEQKLRGYSEESWGRLLDGAGYARTAVPGKTLKTAVRQPSVGGESSAAQAAPADHPPAATRTTAR
jgi:glutaredoxin